MHEIRRPRMDESGMAVGQSGLLPKPSSSSPAPTAAAVPISSPDDVADASSSFPTRPRHGCQESSPSLTRSAPPLPSFYSYICLLFFFRNVFGRVWTFTNIVVSASEVVVEDDVEDSSDSDGDPLTDDFLHHGEEDDGSLSSSFLEFFLDFFFFR